MRVPVARLSAFALSGFLAGVGGALLFAVNERYEVALFGADREPERVHRRGGGRRRQHAGRGARGAASSTAAASSCRGRPRCCPRPSACSSSCWCCRAAWPSWPTGCVTPSCAGTRPAAASRSPASSPTGAWSIRRPPRGRRRLHPNGGDAGPAAPAPATPAATTGIAPADEPGWLSVRGLDVAYDKVQVLFGVDVDIPRGQITALLGTNGAGKSTLLQAIGGVAPVTGGTLRLGDVDLTRLRPEQVPRHGIVQMPGGHGVFPSLTVDENLRVAAWLFRRRGEVAAAHRRGPHAVPRARRAPPRPGRRPVGRPAAAAGAGHGAARPARAAARRRAVARPGPGHGRSHARPSCGRCATRGRRSWSSSSRSTWPSTSPTTPTSWRRARSASRARPRPARQPDLVRAVYLQGARDALASSGPARDGSSPAYRPPVDVTFGRAGPVAGPRRRRSGPVPDRARRGGPGGRVRRHRRRATRRPSVAPGEIVGLIGPNGAGKTTVFDLISGFTAADAGRWRSTATTSPARPPSARARAGPRPLVPGRPPVPRPHRRPRRSPSRSSGGSRATTS